MLRAHWPVGVVLAAFVALGLLYSVVTPVFESPDEPQHFHFVRHLAQTRRLPVQGTDGPWRQEASQPPLYYLIGAVATGRVDAGNVLELEQVNPHAIIGIPLADNNKDRYVHTPAEAFPYRGAALAVHSLRALSVILGAVAVLATYLLALEIGASALLAAGAAAFVAFLPQFLFISGAVNNDSLTAATSGLALWWLVRTMRRGSTWQGAVVAGLLAGAAALSKLAGLGAVGLLVGAYAWTAASRRRSSILAHGALAVAVALALCGWWYLRNLRLYGDLTGVSAMLDIVGTRKPVPSLGRLLGETEGLLLSFWGIFGWFNVPSPRGMAPAFNAIACAALLGLAARLTLMRRLAEHRLFAPGLALLAVWLVAVVAAVLRWASLTMGMQGRLVFPALPAIAVLVVLGLSGLAPRRWRLVPVGAAIAVMAAFAAAVPFVSIMPAYARPPLLGDAPLPPDVREMDVEFEGVAHLIGWRATPEQVAPGGELTVSLYWEALGTPQRDYSEFLHVYGIGNKIVGQRDSYPAGGNYPTTQWRAGDRFASTYRIPIQPGAEPTIGKLVVGLYDLYAGRRLTATDPSGGSANTVFLTEVPIVAAGDHAPGRR